MSCDLTSSYLNYLYPGTYSLPRKRRNLFAGIGGWGYYIKFEGQLIKHTCNRPV
jgi:hypothetical protein